MTPENWTQLVLTLTAAALATGLLAWSPSGRAVFVPFTLALLGAAAATASLANALAHGRVATTVLVTLAAGLAVAGGGPLTTRVFDVVDRGEPAPAGGSVADAGLVLRGGAWIGALERLAVFAGLAAGFPEGVAVVLALKGVGRFPDLKDDATAAGGRGAATERFIIGTFTSVLWAAGCAGLVALVLG